MVNRLTFIAAIVALAMVIAITITTGSILMLGIPVNVEKAS